MTPKKRPQSEVPPATRIVTHGEELPAPGMSELFRKADPMPNKVRVTLHIEAGPNAPGAVVMKKPVLILGRVEGIADVAVGDESASRRHAYIIHRKGKFFLNDMGSTNGTVLNGKLVGEARIKSNDQIQIGTALMRFEITRK